MTLNHLITNMVRLSVMLLQQKVLPYVKNNCTLYSQRQSWTVN